MRDAHDRAWGVRHRHDGEWVGDLLHARDCRIFDVPDDESNKVFRRVVSVALHRLVCSPSGRLQDRTQVEQDEEGPFAGRRPADAGDVRRLLSSQNVGGLDLLARQ